jgi:hypothetical protein
METTATTVSAANASHRKDHEDHEMRDGEEPLEEPTPPVQLRVEMAAQREA